MYIVRRQDDGYTDLVAREVPSRLCGNSVLLFAAELELVSMSYEKVSIRARYLEERFLEGLFGLFHGIGLDELGLINFHLGVQIRGLRESVVGQLKLYVHQ